MEDVLTVNFYREVDGESGLVVFKGLENDGNNVNACMIKMVMGKQAEILYRLLTDQEETVDEIKMKSNNQDFKKNIIIPHTCERCKHEQLPEDAHPCDRCMYGPDDNDILYEVMEVNEDD